MLSLNAYNHIISFLLVISEQAAQNEIVDAYNDAFPSKPSCLIRYRATSRKTSSSSTASFSFSLHFNCQIIAIYSNSFVDDSITVVRGNIDIPTAMNSVRVTYTITATFRTNGNVPTPADMSIDMRNLNIYDQLRNDIESLNNWGGIDRLERTFP